MLTIKLRDIQGVHPEFSRIERDLDLAPVGVPDEALIPKAMAVRINMLYPLVVSRPDALCIGQTTLYRWLKHIWIQKHRCSALNGRGANQGLRLPTRAD